MLVFPQEKRVLSLKETITLGLQNSRELKVTRLSLDSAQLKVDEQLLNRTPSLMLSGSYTRLSSIDPYSLATPFGTFNLTENILDSYAMKLSLTQPIFTGFRLNALHSAAIIGVEATKKRIDGDARNFALKVEEQYWQLFKAKQMKEMLEENIKQIKSHLRDVNNFYQQGMATRNDVMKVEVQLSEIELQLIEATNGIKIANSYLNSLIGLPLDQEISLLDQPMVSDYSVTTLEELITEAQQNRNEVGMVNDMLRAGEEYTAAASSGFYPQVFAVANYNYSNPNQRYFPTTAEFKGSWDVSIAAQMELNFFKSQNTREQAEIEIRKAEESKLMLLDGIALEVKQNYLNLLKAKDKLKASERQVEQSTENLRITNEQFKKGLTGNSEVLDAETMDIMAKTNKIQSVVDLMLAQAKLERALGRDKN